MSATWPDGPPSIETDSLSRRSRGGEPPAEERHRPASEEAAAQSPRLRRSDENITAYYGFVICLVSTLAHVLYYLVSFLPYSVPQALGIMYLPSREWSLLLPVYIAIFLPCMTYVFMASYFFWRIPPLDSPESFTDSHAILWSMNDIAYWDGTKGGEEWTPELRDLPLRLVNEALLPTAPVGRDPLAADAWLLGLDPVDLDRANRRHLDQL